MMRENKSGTISGYEITSGQVGIARPSLSERLAVANEVTARLHDGITRLEGILRDYCINAPKCDEKQNVIASPATMMISFVDELILGLGNLEGRIENLIGDLRL